MNIRHYIYRKYSEELMPRISHIRGAHRLKRILMDVALLEEPKVRDDTNHFREKEWDNLIILDACRHDIYEELEGPTDHSYSPGSHSGHCIENTFSEGDWSDTVYITANPHLEQSLFEKYAGRKPEEVFHSVYRTYETDWNEEEGTVMPEDVVRDAKNAEKLFPEKRKIVHFMQPHHPFINSDIYSRKGFFESEAGAKDVWKKVEKNKVEREKALRAYKDNLELVLRHAKALKSELDGRTVITSDHGNFVGENDFYGHPKYRREKAVRKVPWDVVSKD